MKTLLVLAGILLFDGCWSPPKYYIGGYTVTADAARNVSRNVVDSIVSQIASDLRYEIDSAENRNHVLITLFPANTKPGVPVVRVVLAWIKGDTHVDITVLKDGPEEDENTQRAKKCIETILSRHPEFKWEFRLAHRTTWH